MFSNTWEPDITLTRSLQSGIDFVRVFLFTSVYLTCTINRKSSILKNENKKELHVPSELNLTSDTEAHLTPIPLLMARLGN